MNYDELLRDMERALVAIDASKPYRYEPTTSLPALSPQMQAALDAEAELVASVVKRAFDFAAELDAARAEIERLREDANTTAMDLVDERDDARADLREAMELLRAHGQAPGWLSSAGRFGAVKDWNRRYGELLAKHKETP